MTTNPTLSDVKARLAEIAEEREGIARRETALAAEANELSIAAHVLERMATRSGPVDDKTAGSSQHGSQSAPKVVSPPPTEKEQWEKFKLSRGITGKESTDSLILLCLKSVSYPWQTSADLQKWVSILKGREVPMSTMSPTLSNMKGSGLIIRDGLKVALAERAGNFETQKPELALNS